MGKTLMILQIKYGSIRRIRQFLAKFHVKCQLNRYEFQKENFYKLYIMSDFVSHVLHAGVPGGFPGLLPFRPTYGFG